MRIPERDVTYNRLICLLSVTVLTLIHRYPLNQKPLLGLKLNYIQRKIFEREFEIDFVEFIQYIRVRIDYLC